MISGGPEAKSYPFCPRCFNNPPFEGKRGEAAPFAVLALCFHSSSCLSAAPGTTAMACSDCLHPTCKHSLIRNGIISCPDCETGTLVFEQLSGPKSKISCNTCTTMVRLPSNTHSCETAACVSVGCCGSCS